MLQLREIRTKNHMTQSAVAVYIGMSQQGYASYENGKNSPDPETLSKIADCFKCTVDVLLGREDSNLTPVKEINESAKIMIPVFGKIPSGKKIEDIDFIIDEIELPKAVESDEHDYFALLVEGNSMYPEYMDGDIAIVQKNGSPNTGDDIVVCVNGGDATVKRLILSEKGITLRSLNSSYESVFYSNRDINELPVRIIGVVVEQRRNRK